MGRMIFNIRDLSDEQLDELFHGVIAEMNFRKAKTKNVDVGFWDSNGEYKESIEAVLEFELKEGEAADELG